jgi:hypothetical protein
MTLIFRIHCSQIYPPVSYFNIGLNLTNSARRKIRKGRWEEEKEEKGGL